MCRPEARVCCRYCLALDDVAGDFVTATAQKNPKLKAAALQLLQVQDATLRSMQAMFGIATLRSNPITLMQSQAKSCVRTGVCGCILKGGNRKSSFCVDPSSSGSSQRCHADHQGSSTAAAHNLCRQGWIDEACRQGGNLLCPVLFTNRSFSTCSGQHPRLGPTRKRWVLEEPETPPRSP